MKVWYEKSLREWSIDFNKMIVNQTDPSKQILLRTSKRVKNFYYKLKDNTWVPLSLSSNYKIDKRRSAKEIHSKVTSIIIQENIKNTGVIDKVLRNSKFKVDWQKKKLSFHQEEFDLKCEPELDYHWQYENLREVNVKTPYDQLLPDDLEFIKVNDALKLTMPQNNVKTVIRYYFVNEYETFLNLNIKMQPQEGYEVKDKLLWSWEFTFSQFKYIVNKKDTNNPYGPGYQFASSAKIAANLRKKHSKKKKY